MTHQVEMTAGETVAQTMFGTAMRIDPYGLNGRHTFTREDTSYTIDRMGVSVKKRLARSGLPLSLALPARAFRGVAARTVECEDGSFAVMLELHHRDPQLCVPLLVADNMDDIAADWHSWSRLMKLPMLVIGADDTAQPVTEQLGAIMVENPVDRRKRITSVKHRPWFLRRRRVVRVVGEVERLTADEIIARN